MMTLAEASSYFDRTPILDPDNAAVLFYGQVDPYDDSRRDAGAAYRRILSVAPGTAIPASRAVRVLGTPWLVGKKETDGLDVAHRDKYVLHPLDVKISVSRLAGFLAGTVAASQWTGIEWIKNVKEIEASSSMPEMCRAYLPAAFDVREQDVLWYTGNALLVLEVHQQPSGYTSAECLRLDQVLPATATLAARTYNPATGAYTAGASSSPQCLKVRWQNLFRYDGQLEQKYQEGDCALVLPAATTVNSSDRITLAGVKWAPLATHVFGTAVVVHARRAV